MIHFSCLQCGMKFKVRDEFAGRSTKCSTCKSLIQVPTTSQTLAYVPAESIDGSESSLDKAGVNPSVTLASQSSKESASVDALAKKQVGRYVIDKEIARGGMGAVLRGIDRDIRREVAIKFILNDTDAKQKTRFVEEAQITGQLEHPNIVPVHELGVDAKKRLFFTMKMVNGRSLAQVLEMLAKDSKAEREWSLSRLLNILVNICHALAYAHSRNVIHRDLKPANVMIGDFGEVYVMDWGLAKVLGDNAGRQKPATAAIAAKPLPPTAKATGSGSVSTSREVEGELTQDGSILGTPAYMPPEQALGNIHAVDQRSDIYSLGATLYAVLTLRPPVEKDGNAMALLMRVVEGNIKKPEERAPERYIPAELSSIAMKALAKEPADRYQTVEAFRRDLELFVEGRSVSAKQDTFREQAWKLVKRNRGASVATAAALLVIAVILGFSFTLINNRRVEAVNALKALNDEQEAKRLQAKESVPIVLEAGRFALERRRFPEALGQANLAVGYDEEHAGARILRAKLLITQKDFPAAIADLEKLSVLQPKNAASVRLLELCRKARVDDPRTVATFADAFLEQDEVVLSTLMVQSRDELFALYRKRIEKFWPGASKGLTMTNDGQCTLTISGRDDVLDLEPLRGVRLTVLDVRECPKLRDLGALPSMPLDRLEIHHCKALTDISPLKNMPLKQLVLDENSGIRDLAALKGMPLVQFHLAMPYVQFPLKELEVIRDMPLNSLYYLAGNPPELSLLRDLPLTSLHLAHCHNTVTDLSPLQNMKLETLFLGSSAVLDLSPLEKMPLRALGLGGGLRLQDLAPLSKITSLKSLRIDGCSGVKELSPLANLKLEFISLSPGFIPPEEMEFLRKMPSLKTFRAGFTDYAPATFWKKYDAGEFNK